MCKHAIFYEQMKLLASTFTHSYTGSLASQRSNVRTVYVIYLHLFLQYTVLSLLEFPLETG
jgi:hypothetical protein